MKKNIFLKLFFATLITMLFSVQAFAFNAKTEIQKGSIHELSIGAAAEISMESLLNDPNVRSYVPVRVNLRMLNNIDGFIHGGELDSIITKRLDDDAISLSKVKGELSIGFALLNNNDKVVAIVANAGIKKIVLGDEDEMGMQRAGFQTGAGLIVITPDSQKSYSLGVLGTVSGIDGVSFHANTEESDNDKGNSFVAFSMKIKQQLNQGIIDRFVLETDNYYSLQTDELFGDARASIEKDLGNLPMTLELGTGLKFKGDSVEPYIFFGAKLFEEKR